jgi:hypothetical protein
MSSESLKSLIVTDPDIVDEGIDISGLRTQTDTDPRLLASIADFPGISYDPTSFDYLSDLNELFAYGLPEIDTSGAVTPPDTTTPDTTTPDTGGGGQVITKPDLIVPESPGDFTQSDTFGGQPTFTTTPGTKVDNITGDITNPDGSYGGNIVDEVALTGGAISPTIQPIDPTGMLPQTSTPFMVEGALGVDLLEKDDVLSGAITAKDAADPTFLDRIGLGQFNPAEALVKTAINAAIGKPVTFLIDFLKNNLPPQDPRQTALNELYDVKDGTIQSGLMKGYNPVSGGGLYTLTGGKAGEEPTYGLQEAYQDRIDTIENTLADKYGMTAAEIADVKAGSYTGDVDSELLERLNLLNEAKEKEKGRLDLFSGDIQEIGDAQIAEETIGTLPEITETRQKQGEQIKEIQQQEVARNDDDKDRQQKDTGVAKVAENRYETKSGDVYASAAEAAEKSDGGGSSSSKIVCTMMNESYGFGSFRNKIWMKFHKDLSPEYQKGYHKLFLPLVRIAKTNKIVKKILEHIAVHSTIDMRQATRGKVHLIGRVYRKILLPLCYWVGKYAK